MARNITKAPAASVTPKGLGKSKPAPKPGKTATEVLAAKAPAKSDIISSCKGTSNGGSYIAVAAPGQTAILVPTNRFVGDLQKLGAVGKSFKAFADAWKVAKANPPAAKLANGLDGRSAPHSSKAVADSKAKEAPKAKPAAAKKEAKKAERVAKAAPKADDTRAITILKKDFAFGRDGTARRDSWNKALKAKTAAAYIAAGGAAKYLPRWVAAGAIKLG